jgi:hypothetical protein
VIEQELLSIVEILKEYRSILLGREITVYTDHQNLTSNNLTTSRVIRWRLLIEEFNPTITYIKGMNNVIADTLSRMETTDYSEEINLLTEEPREYPLRLENIARHQREDRSLKKVKNLKEKEINGKNILTTPK